MNKSEFKCKVDSMIPDLTEAIRKECDRLFDCGAIDTGQYEDNYSLPKIIITVAIENQIHKYSPFTDAAKKEVKNLKHF